jgi:hypothetical protein
MSDQSQPAPARLFVLLARETTLASFSRTFVYESDHSVG